MMSPRRISISVDAAGTVQARRRWDNGYSPEGQVRFDDLDRDLLGLFEHWLTLRERVWQRNEIVVLGSLLHRCLFPDAVWSWVQSTIDSRPGETVQLELTFPAVPPYSRLATIPWEYLYRPNRAGQQGQFLAAEPNLIISRYIPSEAGEPVLPWITQPRVLVVVSQPKDPRLGEVDYEDVVSLIQTWTGARGYAVEILHDPTADELQAAVGARRAPGPPHLVHFMGHGSFNRERGEASLALTDPDGGTDWVPDSSIAEIFGRGGQAPRAVVLHCCEGGRADYDASFAGVAPQLVRAGVGAVVAMQYAVTNQTAVAFSTSLYEDIADGVDLAVAVQNARYAIGTRRAGRDPRLIGVPVLYLQNGSALAGIATGTEPGDGS